MNELDEDPVAKALFGIGDAIYIGTIISLILFVIALGIQSLMFTE